jgi:hypothetical protein
MTVGMRFINVAIPEGATISNAYIQFQADEAQSGLTSLTIEGEVRGDANPPTFSSIDGDISLRERRCRGGPADTEYSIDNSGNRE